MLSNKVIQIESGLESVKAANGKAWSKLGWDLNASQDQIAIAVLAPETYEWASTLIGEFRNLREAEHYHRIHNWMKAHFKELKIPILGDS